MKKALLFTISTLFCLFPSNAQPTNSTFCHETQLTFEIVGETNYSWYNEAKGGDLLGNGSSIIVNKNQAFLSASDPDTVYSLFAERKLHGGFSSSEAALGGYGKNHSATLGKSALRMLFTTTKPISIDSITISVYLNSLNCSLNSMPKINLAIYKPNDSTFNSTKSISFTCQGNGEGYYKIPVGIELSSAGNYGIKVTAGLSNSYNLEYYTPSVSLYPRAISNALTITGDDDGIDSTYIIPSLFDWVISLPEDRTEVTNLKNCPLGIELLGFDKNEIAEAYPNPFREDFTFVWKKPEPVSITLSDINELFVNEYQLSGSGSIKLGGTMPTGMYLVKATTASSSYMIKMMKR